MSPTHLKHCVFDPDPRGNPRWYARKKVGDKWRKVRIRAEFDPAGVATPEFMAAYHAALAQLDGEAAAKPAPPREDSFAWLFEQYQRSAPWRAYDAATRADKRSVLGRFVAPIAGLPFRSYRKRDVEASRDKRSETPAAADKLVKYLRVMFAWGVKAGHLEANPAAGVEKLHRTIGWHGWTDAEIKTFRDAYPIGTQARLALELMLQVGARISDAARLGRQHERDGVLSFTAHKNRNRSPVQIDVPIRAELRAAMVPGVVGDLTYLVTERGASFTTKGLGNKFRDWCDGAGLKNCSAHGLRKAAATALAEDGATAHQLMAVFGWQRIETAEIYTRNANRKRLARSAIDLSERRRNKVSHFSKAKEPSETKTGKSDGKSTPK